jgi:hypothetical protein
MGKGSVKNCASGVCSELPVNEIKTENDSQVRLDMMWVTVSGARCLLQIDLVSSFTQLLNFHFFSRQKL